MGRGGRRKDHLTTECRHSAQMPFLWKETKDSLHYRWHSCLNLHFENALSPSGLLCPLPHPCLPGLSGNRLCISDALSPPFWKRGGWSITSKEANEVQSCASSSVCLLQATLSLKCHHLRERNHSHTQKHLLQWDYPHSLMPQLIFTYNVYHTRSDSISIIFEVRIQK